MNAKRMGWCAAALVMVCSLALAQEAMSPQDSSEPAEQAQAERPRRAPARLVKPWSDLPTLSDEQKDQIRAIHARALEEIRAIQQREREEILALLSDEQRTELTELTERQEAERKARAAERRAQQNAQ